MTYERFGLPTADVNGLPRVLGWVPEEGTYGLPEWSDSPFSGPADLRAVNLAEVFPLVPTNDQGQSNRCAGDSTSKACEYARLQSGQPHVDLSPSWVYSLVNGGRDQGSSIAACLSALTQHGCATERTVPGSLLFSKQMPPTAASEAQRFRPSAARRLRGFAELVEALAQGFPCVAGILWCRHYSRVGRDGLLPPPDQSQAVGGHAEAFVGVRVGAGGRPEALAHNSYGERFGVRVAGRGGFAWHAESHFRLWPFEGFAITAYGDDAQEQAADLPVPRAKGVA